MTKRTKKTAELFPEKEAEPILARSVSYKDEYKNATVFDLIKPFTSKRKKIDRLLEYLHKVNKNEAH